jgi:hypothetical protein
MVVLGPLLQKWPAVQSRLAARRPKKSEANVKGRFGLPYLRIQMKARRPVEVGRKRTQLYCLQVATMYGSGAEGGRKEATELNSTGDDDHCE